MIKNLKKIIVSTTINHPTEAIEKFDNMRDWLLIVVGDKKTPKNYSLKNGIYLNPMDQVKIDKKLSQLLGWNCIERRNLGIVYAKKLNADIIALVDDDNIPYKNWGKNLVVGKKIKVNFFDIKNSVFDPLYYTNYSELWHRGYPVNLIDEREKIKPKKKFITPHVQADFWNGDPDIDAICRMMLKPNCKFSSNNFPMFSKKLSPFNSQNTFISGKVLSDYFLFPDQGRMHDIWAAYYLQYVNNINVIYNKPSVFQKRNKHNLINDLKNEFIGLRQTYKLINSMKNNKFIMKNFFSKRAILAFNQYKKHF